MNQKKNTKILIISIILVLILIIGIGISYIVLATDMLKSDKKLFFKYITQIGDSEKGFISKDVIQYFEKQKNTPYQDKGMISFNITSSENQEQFENINKCNIDFSGKVDIANSKSQQDININYSNDVKFPISYRQIENELGLQTQYVGSKYIAVKTNELNKLLNGTMIDQQITLPDNNENTEISMDKLKYIQDTYSDLLNQELKDTSFVKVVEDGLKGYKLTLSGEEFKNILVKLVETLKNDQTLLDAVNECIKSKGLDEIDITDIENIIEEINNNSYVNDEKIEMTVFEHDRRTSKIVININEAKITIEKNENANNKQYNISCELYQDNKTTTIYLNSSFSGLQSLQSITEDWELGIQTSDNINYVYYYNNSVEFSENLNIEDFTNDNSLVLTDLETEQMTTLINAVIERITQVNSQQMERLGVTENENPLIYAIPSLTMYSQSMDMIDDMDIDMDTDMDQSIVESHNTKFENYESLDSKGVTVKGLLSTIQNNNQINENEEYLKITEINFNGEEYEPTEENIILIKSEISQDDTYKVEFEKNSNTGMIYRAVITKN